jgi:formylglycine-generating enzyme required for sulfatase activity
MEYATRAGALTSRYYGESEDLLSKYAWYLKNSQEMTWPVGSLKPNDFGLFDTHGDVFTWCQERSKSYPQSEASGPEEDKEYSDSITDRALRGGSIAHLASYVRSSYRTSSVPADCPDVVGFRPVRTLAP